MANGRSALPIAGTRCQGKVGSVSAEIIVAGKLEAGTMDEAGCMWPSWIRLQKMDACRAWMREHREIRAAWRSPGRRRCYRLTEMCRRRAVSRGRILRVTGLRAAALRSAFLSGTESPLEMGSAGVAKKVEKIR